MTYNFIIAAKTSFLKVLSIKIVAMHKSSGKNAPDTAQFQSIVTRMHTHYLHSKMQCNVLWTGLLADQPLLLHFFSLHTSVPQGTRYAPSFDKTVLIGAMNTHVCTYKSYSMVCARIIAGCARLYMFTLQINCMRLKLNRFISERKRFLKHSTFSVLGYNIWQRTHIFNKCKKFNTTIKHTNGLSFL